jgi:hypothetical protein
MDLRDAYVYDTGEIPPSTMWLTEILVPPRDQDRQVVGVGLDYAYPQATVYSSHPDDTLTGALSMTGVIRAIEKGPQSHAEGRMGAPWVPAWTLAVIMLGVVLMAIGFLLNEPITWVIYRTIHGG